MSNPIVNNALNVSRRAAREVRARSRSLARRPYLSEIERCHAPTYQTRYPQLIERMALIYISSVKVLSGMSFGCTSVNCRRGNCRNTLVHLMTKPQYNWLPTNQYWQATTCIMVVRKWFAMFSIFNSLILQLPKCKQG